MLFHFALVSTLVSFATAQYQIANASSCIAPLGDISAANYDTTSFVFSETLNVFYISGPAYIAIDGHPINADNAGDVYVTKVAMNGTRLKTVVLNDPGKESPGNIVLDAGNNVYFSVKCNGDGMPNYNISAIGPNQNCLFKFDLNLNMLAKSIMAGVYPKKLL